MFVDIFVRATRDPAHSTGVALCHNNLWMPVLFSEGGTSCISTFRQSFWLLFRWQRHKDWKISSLVYSLCSQWLKCIGLPSNDGIMDEKWIGINVEGSGRGPVSGTLPAIGARDWWQPLKFQTAMNKEECTNWCIVLWCVTAHSCFDVVAVFFSGCIHFVFTDDQMYCSDG
jgi:hypothetical protein